MLQNCFYKIASSSIKALFSGIRNYVIDLFDWEFNVLLRTCDKKLLLNNILHVIATGTQTGTRTQEHRKCSSRLTKQMRYCCLGLHRDAKVEELLGM